ncbi:MAG: hypothetical protein GX495_17300 [Chloroflexi bacterium]|nr:hypothetical protein [Chloroflexota bacterium]
MRTLPSRTRLSVFQGLVYIATGIWPLISPRTFQMVTGPKVDIWLVNTVGLLITITGVVLARAALRGQVTEDVELLAEGSAGALAAVDIYYAGRRRLSPVYLLDAALEITLAALWLQRGNKR